MFTLVTCEHGGNRIPPEFRRQFAGSVATLGTHRGYDLGALDFARNLARRLNAPLHSATLSRLVVDLNRSLHHPRVFSEVTRSLPDQRRAEIVARYYEPYRNAVEQAIWRAIKRRQCVMHFSCHSFTPQLHGEIRRADVGLLYDPGRSLERSFCRQLRQWLHSLDDGPRVRLNYPYRGTADGFTTYLRRQFGERQYGGVEIEINQRFFLDDRPAWPRLQRQLLQALAETITLF